MPDRYEVIRKIFEETCGTGLTRSTAMAAMDRAYSAGQQEISDNIWNDSIDAMIEKMKNSKTR